MKKIGLIFPHQLFEEHPVLKECNEVYLIEDSLFFADKYTKLRFHKAKLVFHRASMKAYEQLLIDKGVKVHYIDYQKEITLRDYDFISNENHCIVVDPTDYLLEKRLKETIENLTILDTPLFINSKEDNEKYMKDRDSYFMHHFYQWQRKRLDILIDNEGKPEGGSWSYDDMNRKKVPQKLIPELPHDPQVSDSSYVTEAKKYV
jgi:deoxyribodipyrimidine photolyase-related protein